MTSEQKLDFSRRVSQGNRSDLIVIMYDMFSVYVEDAKENQNNLEEYLKSLRNAEAVVDSLRSSLDFSYEVSKELYSLYQYVMCQVSVAMYKNRFEELLPAIQVMEKLRVAFAGVAAQDTSAPLMQNVEHVVAGMTYGRGSLVENNMGFSTNRGFLA